MTEFTKEHLLDIRKAVGEFVTRTERALAAFALALMERAENAEAERDRLKKENDKFRSIAANSFMKYGGECHYCGVDSIEKCPHGFPGCSIADDILCGEEKL